MKLNTIIGLYCMVNGVKNDTEKELVFTLITCAPSGTLGDVSSCKKYIEKILANHSVDAHAKITFNLVITGVDDSEVKKKIDALLGENPVYKRMYTSSDNDSFFKHSMFKKSSAFIFYPSFQIISEKHIRAIKRLNKPTIIVNHYNFDASADKRYAAKKEQWMPALYTGFGLERLGVNIEDLGSHSSNISIPKDDADIYNLLFNTRSASTLTKDMIQQYLTQKSLFFGYMNKLSTFESNRNLANPVEFVTSCIAKSQKQQKKEIDIVLPLNANVHFNKEVNHYEQLIKYVQKNHAGLTVSIYKKDPTGKLVKNTFGYGKETIKVRIIDPFPISHNTMITMMQLSDPFCMSTGSESFIESLSCNKLPLYQIMRWHDRLYNELLQEIASIQDLGDTSLLYQYFVLQDKSKGATHEQLVEFLCTYEIELLEQLQVLKYYLLANKELSSKLHHRLIELTHNNEEYIHQCFDERCLSHFNDEPELSTKIKNLPQSIIQLYQMFPQSKEIMCQDAAQLLEAIANRDKGEAAKNMLHFVTGYKQFEGNEKVYPLFTDLLSLLTDHGVKKLIADAELEWRKIRSSNADTDMDTDIESDNDMDLDEESDAPSLF